MIKQYYYKYVHIETWREMTGTSGHMTVLGFLVCAQGCKISGTRIILVQLQRQ